jgi:hypothetical protein
MNRPNDYATDLMCLYARYTGRIQAAIGMYDDGSVDCAELLSIARDAGTYLEDQIKRLDEYRRYQLGQVADPRD